MNNPFRIRFFTLAGLFGMVHVLATQYYLYWYLAWFDLLMHVWGGVLLILALGTLVEVLPRTWTHGWWRKRVVMGYVLGVIVVWEIMGVILNQGLKPDWLVDTIGDIVFGILGALIGYWWGKRYIRRNI